ncbi:hypothetical protein K7X08_015696 [Anisodus acutangulus]|uniref:Uncharacterized protein n=1 Tax=Anisodus acutangulus TaxID=402998 RepID=A0A9Q1QYY1_9SOLA|nr:hypothetical protein K7X08_015696 [Anisodus acutangulus]
MNLLTDLQDCSLVMFVGSQQFALHNGMVLQFDQRQTTIPVESMTGLTGNPVHTACATRTLVAVTEAGLKRPCLVPELENQGICISLACGDRNDDIVASFRPKLEISGDMVASQVFPTPVSTMDQAVEGSHVL